LTDIGRRLGLVDDYRWDVFNRKRDAITLEKQRLTAMIVSTSSQEKRPAIEVLKRPEVRYADLVREAPAPAEVAEQLEIQVKYEGYIERQREEVARRRELEGLALPVDLDYRSVKGLSVEVQQKLNRHRPETIGQASRISGITLAAISLLLVHLKRGFQPSKKTA